MKEYIKKTISMFLTIILIFFIWHKFLLSGNTIILVMLVFPIYNFLKNTIENENKRKFIVSSIIAVCFAIVELICNSINIDYTLNYILDKWIILNFLGYTILAWSIISSIFTLFEQKSIHTDKRLKVKKFELFSNTKFSFIITAGLIFLAWIPYFLRYYPGLLTADSCTQVAQAIGIAELSNHHPIFHTGIITVFVNIGKLIFKNINVGIAFYTIFQMLIMSFIFASVIQYLNKKQAPIIVRIIILLYYMFYPINALFSITMWKDILFAGSIPIYVILVIELLSNTENFLKSKKYIITYIIISVLVMFLRNNGMYIVLLTIPLIIITLRKYFKKIIPISVIIIFSYIILRSTIFNIFNIKEGSVGEMLSIPLQQIARVEKYHNEELDEETIKQISDFFKCENIGEKYNPILSDPVKAQLDTEYFDAHKGEFIKLWVKLLKVYFKDYVESFISNSYGYYYPEAKHWVANRTMEPNNMEISQQPLIKGEIVSKIDSLIERRDIPILSMFFSIGTAFWLIVICLGYKIVQKEYKYIISYFIIFILWLTIVASPVFCEYRYAYPMFVVLPLYIGLNFVKDERKR